MEAIACPETSVTNYLSKLRRVPEEQKSWLVFVTEMCLLRGTNWIYGIRGAVHGRYLSSEALRDLILCFVQPTSTK